MPLNKNNSTNVERPITLSADLLKTRFFSNFADK